MRRVILLLVAVSCSRGGGRPVEPVPAPPVDAAPAPGPVVISVVGTNDLHGQLHALPILAGYVANLRAARARDGGGVLLIDAGDMFQGSLESNLDEGATVMSAYAAIGYDAATIGNHEFDFGPPGPAVVARGTGDDPRGALKQRAREAAFPLLMANIAESGGRPAWPGIAASTVREVAGVKVGIIGVTTMQTPTTTMPANFTGLQMLPIAEAIAGEAEALRRRGALLVIVAAHAGGECVDFTSPEDLSTCKEDAEIFAAARALPVGAVDVIVAGHTHAGVAHQVAGVAIIESFARGKAFGRVDVTVVPTDGAVVARRIFPPQPLCPGETQTPCAPGDYEGAPVVASTAIAAAIEPAYARARAKRDELLGVRLDAPVLRAHKEESALGNLFADLMRRARPADVAMTNGGGLRTDLPAGPLTYGALFEATPFDNRFATVKLSGADLRKVIAANLASQSGILSLSGVRAVARCKGKALAVEIVRDSGKPVKDADQLVIVTSDFLASGGDGLFPAVGVAPEAFALEDGEPIRDVMAAELKKLGGVVAVRTLFDPKRPRLSFPGPKPVACN